MMTPGPSWRKSLPLVGAIEKQSVAGRPEPLRDVHALELDPVGVVEEAGVVAGAVVVLLQVVLDLQALLADPAQALIDDLARRRIKREVMNPDAVAIVAAGRLRLYS